MKSNYGSLWLLLAFALVTILIVAFGDDIQIGNYTVKKAPFREHLLTELSPSDSLDFTNSNEVLDESVVPINEKKVAVDSLPQSIFIFGDSMTFNLALRLAQYARQNGHEIHSVNWDSSNTKIWADSDTLLYFIRKYRPTQIFVSLGSNELYLKNPGTRVKFVNRIIEMIDTIPFVWIGPPNWKEDSGINDMLERECGHKRFFRSAGMHFDRKADKIHPTRESSAKWIDSVARWMPKSSHPIVMDSPSDSIGKANPNIVFLKALNK